MKISVISFTDRGHILSGRIAAALCMETVVQYAKADGFLSYDNVRAFAARAFAQDDAVIFVGASGIAVRAIAPYVCGKATDPAVLVLDENGRFVISLLSGHLGGANCLTERLAAALNATAVITTATDGRGIFAADSWAAQHNCTVADISQIQHISGALLRGETVGLCSDFPIAGQLPDGIKYQTACENGIFITIQQWEALPFAHTLVLLPRIVHVGIGCRRGTEPEKLKNWVSAILCQQQIDLRAVASISSIDLKADEPALNDLARDWKIPVHFYTAAQLEAVLGSFPPSEFVRKTTGTDNVCQRAAARSAHEGNCLLAKTAQDGMTISVYQEDWRVSF